MFQEQSAMPKLMKSSCAICENCSPAVRYRTADEMTRWRARDPVTRFQNFLLSKGWWDAKLEKELRMNLRKEVQTELDFSCPTFVICIARSDCCPP